MVLFFSIDTDSFDIDRSSSVSRVACFPDIVSPAKCSMYITSKSILCEVYQYVLGKSAMSLGVVACCPITYVQALDQLNCCALQLRKNINST